jgi:hypothetical protein
VQTEELELHGQHRPTTRKEWVTYFMKTRGITASMLWIEGKAAGGRSIWRKAISSQALNMINEVVETMPAEDLGVLANGTDVLNVKVLLSRDPWSGRVADPLELMRSIVVEVLLNELQQQTLPAEAGTA